MKAARRARMFRAGANADQESLSRLSPRALEGIPMKALLFAVVAAAAVTLAAPGHAQDASAPTPAAPSSGTLNATLVGDLEVPDEGDPDGKATATITIDGTKLCYTVDYHRLAPVTMAHIHTGAAGKAGDPVVVLKMNADYDIKGCTVVTADLAAALLAEPGNYYVNVHTTELPKGAIRGQLGK